MPRILMICDPSWSTGSMARDLAALLSQHTFELHDWSTIPAPERLASYDVICCMTLTCAARVPLLRDWPTAVHAMLHPNEIQLPEVRALATSKLTLSAVSLECVQLTQDLFEQPVLYTPIAVHMERFTRREAPHQLHRAGFIGFPQAEHVQVTGSTKRPEMFTEICLAAGLEPVYSGKGYTYETMQQFYDAIDVLICTSSVDGGPLPPLEAIACGKPALSSDVGCMRDFGLTGRFDTVEQAVQLLRISKPREWANQQYEQMQRGCGGHQVAHLWDALFREVTG